MNRFRFPIPWLGFTFMIAMAASPARAIETKDVFRAYLQTGQSKDALEAFRSMVHDNPGDALAQGFLGYLALSHGSREEALAGFLAALEEGRARPEATLYLLEAMRLVRNPRDGLRVLEVLDRLLTATDFAVHTRSAVQFQRARLLQRLGRWDEATQAFTQLNFITQFWICGPFDNAEKGGHERVFGPEEKLALDASYPGRHRQVSWQPLPYAPYDGYINLHDLVQPSQESTVYLLARLEADSRQRAFFTFGHAGALKAWLNGKLIVDMNRYHSPLPDQVNVEQYLEAGENTLMLKVSSGEQGKFGVYARLRLDEAGNVHPVAPTAGGTLPGLAEHTPAAGQTLDDNFSEEPIVLQQLKALGESLLAEPHHHLFYALLIQELDVADENDHSANTMLSRLSQLYPDNPFLIRLLGESEQQENRQRLAYQRALEIDPGDQAAFLDLLDYYRNSPYATKGFELYHGWKANQTVSMDMMAEYAQMLQGQALSEEAIQVLRSIPADERSSYGEWLLYQYESSILSDAEQAQRLQQILDHNAMHAEALAALSRLALRRHDLETYRQLLVHGRRIQPFSVKGELDLALFQQTEGDYQASLDTLNQVLQVCPSHFEAHRLAAVAYHALERDDEAIANLQAALSTQPSNPWCLEYMEFLQPEGENYATPYLKDWHDVAVPDNLDLSKANYLALLNQRILKVHPNGNSSEWVREAVRILTDTGVRYQQTRVIDLESDSEELRILRARVWKPDGTFYDAPRPEYRDASPSGGAGATVYMDYKLAVIRFPALEKGSVIELEYEKKQKTENIYADYFGDMVFMGDQYFEPSVYRDYVLITPQNRNFYWKFTDPHYPESVRTDGTELPKDPEITENGAERVFHWTGNNLPSIPIEPLMPSPSEILPYITVSTFPSWSDLMAWYWNLVQDQLKSGTVVKQQVEKVLADYRQQKGYGPEQALNQWDIVRAINAYINTQVRYLGLEFGIHGYKPHKVDEICNAQYGDCKDKATLAVAMLKEAGIDANMVLLRTTDNGDVDYDIPVFRGYFNHMIYYVPDLDGRPYWIDGTATYFDALELPSGDSGANSLILKPGGGYEFKRIPHSSTDSNGGVYTTVLTLDPDGNAQGYRYSEFRGLYNPMVRRSYENPAKAKELIDRSLASRFPGAESANIQLSDMDDYSTTERVSYDVKVPSFAMKQENQLLVPVTIFPESMSQRYATVSKREYDLILNYPWTRNNGQTITVPKDWSHLQLPPDRSLETPFGSYKRTGEWKNGEITIKEELILHSVRVAKEDYQGFRDFCRLVDQYQEEKVTASP